MPSISAIRGQESTLKAAHIVACTIGKSAPVDFMIDSGADVNVITLDVWERLESTGAEMLDINWEPETSIRSYASNSNLAIRCTFKAWIRAEAKGKPETFAEFVVVEGGSKSLLGRQSAIEMRLLALGLEVNLLTDKGARHQKFPSIPGLEIHFEVDEFVLPSRHAYVNIPIHYQQAANERLKIMELTDIIEPAEGAPRWISGMSAVPKGRNDFRLIVNMRGPNRAIQRQFHQMPRVDEMKAKLIGARYFTKLDLHSAFHHVMISKESRELTTFMAPNGMFRFKRLVFGVNCAPEIFQRIMENILKDVENVIIYIDDILIFAPTMDHLKKETEKVLAALKENNLTLNNEKCVYEVETLSFLGHQLSAKGLNIEEQKVRDIEAFREPKTASELRSFLGLASYVSAYIPHFADLTEPMWRVTGNNDFEWGEQQSVAFRNVKKAIVECTTSQGFFDIKDTTYLYTDASPHALGAVLVQKNDQDKHRIISFASKTLTKTERNYPQTQREALAVVWATEHYYYYLLGNKFTIRTDAQGIAYIFDRGGDSPKRMMRRAEGWAMRLDAFQFSIEFVKGSANIADPSSRLYEGDSEAYVEHEAPCEIGLITISEPGQMKFDDEHLPLAEVSYQANLDSQLTAVRRALTTGDWPQELSPYKAVQENLRETNGVLTKDGLAVIPLALRQKALALAHKGHPGRSKTKSILRERVWWPAMGKAAEEFVDTCTACTLNGRREPPTPMERTRLPEAPWDFLAIDYCGPYSIFGGVHILVMLDYYSRFVVASPVSSTDFKAAEQFFERVFDQYGYPGAIKSDNGPPFNSGDYKEYCVKRGISPVFSWPLTPQQNGMAERAMQLINKAMQSASVEKRDFRKSLAETVRAHNTALHRTTNEVPSDLMFARKLRRSLPLAGSASFKVNDEEIRIRDWDEKQKSKVKEDKKRGARDSRIMVGDTVVIRRTVKRKGDSNYDPAELKVTEKRKGDLTLTASDGHTVKRHITLARKVVKRPTMGEANIEIEPAEPAPENKRPKRNVKPPVRYVAPVEM